MDETFGHICITPLIFSVLAIPLAIILTRKYNWKANRAWGISFISVYAFFLIFGLILNDGFQSTSSPLPTNTYSRVISTSPSAKIQHTNTPIKTISTPDCLNWVVITLDDVGRKICIWGYVKDKYIDWYDPNVHYVMYITFGNTKGDFYILSYDYDIPDLISGDCIQVTADIQQLGSSPVIVVNQEDILYKCNY